MRKIFKVFLLVSLLAGFAIITMGADSQGCSSKTSSSPNTGPGSTDEPIKVEIAAFLKEFDANKIAAQDKYNDKNIQTTGYIGNISGGDLGGIYVIVNPSPGEVQYGVTIPYIGSSIQCYMEKADASALVNGQQVAVKGLVSDQLMGNVQVKNCSVVK